MRRRVLLGIGSLALGVGSIVATATPASAAGPIQIGGTSNCLIFINLGIIPPIAIGCPS